MAIATAAKQIIVDRMDIVVAGGSGIDQPGADQGHARRARPRAAGDAQRRSTCRCSQTAEVVAKRYGISREAQDEYALQSQQRTAAAQAAGNFDDEIVP